MLANKSVLAPLNIEFCKEPFTMIRKRTISGENESPTKHTKVIKLEPDLDECDIKIEPVEIDDGLLCGHFDRLHNIGDHDVKSSTADRLIKCEQIDDDNSMLSGHLDRLHASGDATMAESTDIMGRLTRDTCSSMLHQRNCVPTVLPRQKIRNNSTRFNLTKIQPVEIDQPRNSAKENMNMEMNTGIQAEDNLGNSSCCYEDSNAESKLKHDIFSHDIRTKTSSDESCSYENGHSTVKFTAETLFSCELCSYETGNKGYLKRHFLTHTGGKPFSCVLCSYKTGLKGSLTVHMLIHAEEKPFTCELCSYKTGRKGDLKKHSLTHTGEKPFSCEICSYKTGNQGYLKRHVLIHTGEQPFSCELCSYKTGRNGNLKTHMLTHTGEQPFSCELCSYKTGNKGHLKRHFLIHSREKHFSCEICSYKTGIKGDLKKHCLTHAG